MSPFLIQALILLGGGLVTAAVAKKPPIEPSMGMPPLELFTMLGGSVTGFLFRYMAERAKDRQEQFERMMNVIKAADDSADKAAARVPADIGKGVRRLIVVAVLFGVILAPFILTLIGKPTIVEIHEPVKEWAFGLWSTGGRTVFVEMQGYLLIPEVRQTLTALIGFYFGSAAGKSKGA